MKYFDINMTLETGKSRFHELLNEHHPDKYFNQPEMLSEKNRITFEIKQEYELFKNMKAEFANLVKVKGKGKSEPENNSEFRIQNSALKNNSAFRIQNSELPNPVHELNFGDQARRFISDAFENPQLIVDTANKITGVFDALSAVFGDKPKKKKRKP
jgi:hypothetical protein